MHENEMKAPCSVLWTIRSMWAVLFVGAHETVCDRGLPIVPIELGKLPPWKKSLRFSFSHQQYFKSQWNPKTSTVTTHWKWFIQKNVFPHFKWHSLIWKEGLVKAAQFYGRSCDTSLIPYKPSPDGHSSWLRWFVICFLKDIGCL